MTESDPMPLDGERELDPAERLWVRKAMRDDARMSWARKQLRWILVTAASVAVGGWAFVEWVREHIVIR